MKKFLIVDDSATMRRSIMRVLRQTDTQVGDVVEAGNGKDGLQALVADPEIGMAFLDINMSEMNGIDFVKAIRTRRDRTSLPVIMTSTEGGESMMQTAIGSGANGYVTKPLTPGEHPQRVGGIPCLSRRQPMGPSRPSGFPLPSTVPWASCSR